MQPPPGYANYGQPPKKNTNTALIVVVAVVVGFCGILVLFAILFPVFAQARTAALRTSCLANVKSQALGLLQYAAESDEKFPPASKWMDLTTKYVKGPSVFHCPTVHSFVGEDFYGYALNSHRAGKSLANDPAPMQIALLFDSGKSPRNAASGLEGMATPGQHPRGTHRGNTVGFCDGHGAFVLDDQRASIRP